jgi:hypothetical protein
MGVEIFVIAILVLAFVAVRWFWRILDVAADALQSLFLQDEEKWWWEKELPKAIGRSGFLTRAALNLLNEEGALRKKVLLNAIYVYSSEGGHYPGVMLLVQLDDDVVVLARGRSRNPKLSIPKD